MIQLPANTPQRVALYSDIHCDTHDPRAINLACKIFRDFKPTIAINMGDMVNMDAISRFTGDPKKTIRIQAELDAAFEVQQQINQATGKARRLFIKGNHEDRLDRALKAKIPGLVHLEILKLNTVLRLDELGMEYVEDDVMLGSVRCIHGWAARKWSGTSPRYALEAIGYTHSIVQGHSHRQSIISKATYPNGTVFGCEVGYLGDYKKMDYLSAPPDWQRGIALLEWKDGKPAFEIIPFFGNVKLTALWRGKLYRA